MNMIFVKGCGFLSNKNKIFRLSEMAHKIGMSTRTLIRWDEQGLFVPFVSPAGQKYYTYFMYLNYLAISNIPFDQIKSMDHEITDEDMEYIRHKRHLSELAASGKTDEEIKQSDASLDDLDMGFIETERKRLRFIESQHAVHKLASTKKNKVRGNVDDTKI